MNMGRLVFWQYIGLILVVITVSCDSFEHTPWQHTSPDEPSNQWNLRKLNQQSNPDAEVKIAFIGDTQRFYSNTKSAVEKINQLPGIDLVLISGDITDFGLYLEFEEMSRILEELNPPYFAAIGNHDVINNGPQLFEDYFGPDHQLFEYEGYYFLLHNTNSVAVGFDGSVPDLPKIRASLAQVPEGAPIIAISHIPPRNVDFDPKLNDDYEQLWADEGVLLSLNGHNHSFNEWVQLGVQYVNSASPSKGELVEITLIDTNFTITRHSF